jgi:hypothetical protein
MGLKIAKTSLWLVGVPQWRGSRTQNGESTSRLWKKILFTVPDCNTACYASDAAMEKTIEAFEEVYELQAKFSMAKMAIIVQELGNVMKKKHRCKAKQPH